MARAGLDAGDRLKELQDYPPLISPDRVRLFDAQGRVVTGRNTMTQVFRGRLTGAVHDDPFVSVVDGPPGSGKSGMEEKLRTCVQASTNGDHKVPMCYEIDSSIGSPRGPKRDALKDCDSAYFEKNLFRYPLAEETAHKIWRLVKRGDSGKVPVKNGYDRTNGVLVSRLIIDVPEDVDVLIIEGAGSLRVADALQQKAGIPENQMYRILMSAPYLQSLFNAILRDLIREKPENSRTFLQRFFMRTGEYQHLVPMLREHAKYADVICKTFSGQEHFERRMVTKLGDAPEDIRRIVRAKLAHPENRPILEAVFPKGIPADLLNDPTVPAVA